MLFRVSVVCLFSLGVTITLKSAPPPNPSLDIPAARRELDQQWQTLGIDEGAGIRGVFRFITEGAAIGYDPARLEQGLEIARRAQDTVVGSPTFGNFKWALNAVKVADLNAVEFCMQQAAVLAKFQVSHLNANSRNLLEQILRDSIRGILAHKVDPAYTNIYVMKTWNLISLGEVLHNPSVAAEGYKNFKTWIEFTAQNGIPEYLSPTYYGVTLDSLALISKYAEQSETRALASYALRYLWADIAANWFESGERLGGAHGRNYDYLRGRGYLDAQLSKAGWLSWSPQIEESGWLPHPKRDHLTYLLDAFEAAPSTEMTQVIRRQLPRMVYQKCGTASDAVASQYVGRTFSIGSANLNHGQEDHSLVLYWPGDRNTLQSDFILEARGDPYGVHPFPDVSGAHNKAMHLEPFVASVQRGPEVLQLVSTDATQNSNRYGVLTGLYGHLTLPLDVSLWQKGIEIKAGTPNHPASLDALAPVFLRLGNVVFGLRLVFSEGGVGTVPSLNYVQDEDVSAKRITFTLSSTPPTRRGSLAVWIKGEEGLNDDGFKKFSGAFALTKIEETFENDVISLVVPGQKNNLKLKADLGRRKRLVGAGDLAEAKGLLIINDHDIGRDIFFGALTKKPIE